MNLESGHATLSSARAIAGKEIISRKLKSHPGKRPGGLFGIRIVPGGQGGEQGGGDGNSPGGNGGPGAAAGDSSSGAIGQCDRRVIKSSDRDAPS